MESGRGVSARKDTDALPGVVEERLVRMLADWQGAGSRRACRCYGLDPDPVEKCGVGLGPRGESEACGRDARQEKKVGAVGPTTMNGTGSCVMLDMLENAGTDYCDTTTVLRRTGTKRKFEYSLLGAGIQAKDDVTVCLHNGRQTNGCPVVSVGLDAAMLTWAAGA